MTTNNTSNALRVVPPGFVEAAIVLLLKVLGNIIATPDEPKFRKLKKTNKQVEAKILPCRGALQMLIVSPAARALAPLRRGLFRGVSAGDVGSAPAASCDLDFHRPSAI